MPADRRTHEQAKTIGNRAIVDAGDGGAVRWMRYEMLEFMEQCVDRYVELAGTTIDTLRYVSTPGVDEHSYSRWATIERALSRMHCSRSHSKGVERCCVQNALFICLV